MNISKESMIGVIVAEDYRTASVFEQAGIDFCCRGNRSIADACREQKIAADELIGNLKDKIEGLAAPGNTHIDYRSWPLDLLADFIEKRHHRYASAQIPAIQTFLEKLIRVHGVQHPELAEIKAEFDACAGALTSHMKKEELMLFPIIRKMVPLHEKGSREMTTPFGSIQNPIRVMMSEHDSEGERFRRIKELSNNYTVPADGCNTYGITLVTLKAFEEDLHLHIHLENNILFPRAIEMERHFAR